MSINIGEALKPIIEVQAKSEEWMRIPVPAALVSLLDLGGLETALRLPIDGLFTSRLSKNGQRYFSSPGLWLVDGEVHIFFGYLGGVPQSVKAPGNTLIKQGKDLLLPIGKYLLPVWPGRLDREEFDRLGSLVNLGDLDIPELPKGSGVPQPPLTKVVQEGIKTDGSATFVITDYPVAVDGKYPRFVVTGVLNGTTGTWQCSGGLGSKLLAHYALNGEAPVNLKIDTGSFGDYVTF